jgi:hypothetical protein
MLYNIKFFFFSFCFSVDNIKYSYPNLYLKMQEFDNKYIRISKVEESLELQCVQSTVDNLGRRFDFEVVNTYVPYKNFPLQRLTSSPS